MRRRRRFLPGQDKTLAGDSTPRIVEPLQPDLYICVVGYDPPLRTFFAQVLPIIAENEDNLKDFEPILWLGTSVERISSVDSLAAAVEAFAIIPEEIIEQLKTDQTLS